ncbi:MAG: T9SS type A sorting domain-containing protein [Bacteroidales bacterium]|nr:T9SS type A sorting domain-containing protein [Bacteroidales bacterium]MCF8458359.1 T9SS type A sorting domain-containing protein [Bacteroidales bacterium]
MTGPFSDGCHDTIVIGYIYVDANPDTLFRLYPNAPNPFSTETYFRFHLPQDDFVEVSIYALSGKLVDVLPTHLLDKGNHSLTYKNTKLTTGIYYYRVKIDGGVKVGKMVVGR